MINTSQYLSRPYFPAQESAVCTSAYQLKQIKDHKCNKQEELRLR